MNHLILTLLVSINSGLIGGEQANQMLFHSTVYVDRNCTASKVAPKLFLLAAHCVKNGPYKNTPAFIKNIFNQKISLTLKTHFSSDFKVSVDKIYIHPSFEKEIS